MGELIFTVGGYAVDLGTMLIALGLAATAMIGVMFAMLARGARERRAFAAAESERTRALEERIGALTRIQAEMIGGLRAMSDGLGGGQAELSRTVSERLDAVTARLGQSMETTTRHTAESLRHLHERLAVIDRAQKNLTDLSSQVTSLREVLANKQARGAFGQGRMETIVRDGLPRGSYEFQFTLSNRTRPDCVIFTPGDDRPLVVDAKFPLEAITAFRAAGTGEARKHAAQCLRQDVLKHVNDIAGRYLISGETQDVALMFVPSESVYAELHENFDDVIQRAYRAQVMLVSPSLLMLAIQVTQQILKDARMREAAAEIRTEVGHLTGDIGRLRERVLKLQQHFGHASEDVTQILVSADKIAKRGGRIEALEFDEAEAPGEPRIVPASVGNRIQAGE
jgi:DNA recombination protein RmuC